MKAAPTAGFEQLSEIFQPLLGKCTPARDDVAAAGHVGSICHESARKEKNGRRRNRNESTDVTEIFCGKLLFCPARSSTRRHASSESRRNSGFCFRSAVKRRTGMAALRD